MCEQFPPSFTDKEKMKVNERTFTLTSKLDVISENLRLDEGGLHLKWKTVSYKFYRFVGAFSCIVFMRISRSSTFELMQMPKLWKPEMPLLFAFDRCKCLLTCSIHRGSWCRCWFLQSLAGADLLPCHVISASWLWVGTHRCNEWHTDLSAGQSHSRAQTSQNDHPWNEKKMKN